MYVYVEMATHYSQCAKQAASPDPRSYRHAPNRFNVGFILISDAYITANKGR